MRLFWLACLVASTGLVIPAKAASVASGLGTRTCAEFAKDYQNHITTAENAYFSWAQGFMTGKNFARILEKIPARDIGAKTIQSQKTYLRAFCSENPLDDYGKAANSLYESMPIYNGR